ncbi:uncharacterized protein [Porites lutea]|uniref:uncharacterized protein n=1 Tax=Porites lutea TaxID=51062 RepID=UPI003CC66B10
MANKSCKSVNVLPDADFTRRICQLNNKTRQMKPGDFMKTKGSSYYGSIKISCLDISHNKKTQTSTGYCYPVRQGKSCLSKPEKSCKEIKNFGKSQGDGMYWLDPDGGNHSNAFLAYCDMTSFQGGWTMCYSTDEYAKPKSEVAYSTQFPYGKDGYRTNCNNIPFSEIIFLDHQTGNKAYFKRRSRLSVTAASNYNKLASTYGLWDGEGVNKNYSYQLLICDDDFYSGFFVSGYTNCFKRCVHWCGDDITPYFRTASTDPKYKGVAFNINGHYPHVVENRLISVGLR